MGEQVEQRKVRRLLSILSLVAASILATSCWDFFGTPNDTDSETDVGGQMWILTFNDSGSAPHPQTIEVYVAPFTNSGTWGEVGDSAGLWMYGTDGVCTYRLMVGGNVVHDGSGDRFSCVNLGNSGCGMQTLGSCDFVANGNFPNATTVSGTYTLTTTSSLGTATATNTIDGYIE
jgi:hypothetical protein